jgi:hypothetical protein
VFFWSCAACPAKLELLVSCVELSNDDYRIWMCFVCGVTAALGFMCRFRIRFSLNLD